MMNARGMAAAVILAGLCLLGVVACTCGWLVVPFMPQHPACGEAPYSNPPAELEDADLVGTWATQYYGATDRLIINADGTFRQVYEERFAGVLRLYLYQTPWNRWWVERFSDGRIRVHFEGARYYLRGSGIAELEGTPYGASSLPWPFRDPFSDEYVDMVGRLVLTVRVDSRGELLLHHMFYSADEGFGRTHCQQQYFRRVETP
jgi:hypothetical protein